MFEEVKEMIDSTIYTNGRGEVTAQNVNLAMHGCVDAIGMTFGEVNNAVKAVEDKVTALEENGRGGGSGALKVWINEAMGMSQLTEEQLADNILAFTKIQNGELVNFVLCGEDTDDGVSLAFYPTSVGKASADICTFSVVVAMPVTLEEIVPQGLYFELSSDGSVTMH